MEPNASAASTVSRSTWRMPSSVSRTAGGIAKIVLHSSWIVVDAIPDDAPPVEKIRLALRGHLRVVAEQLDVATVFVQEWRYLEGERRDEFVAERRRYEERIRDLFREGRELSELRADLDEGVAALLLLSAANWAYTWLQAGRDTDELADRSHV